MQKTQEHPDRSKLVRRTVECALVGLLCVLLFLWSGFTPWSMGLGIMFGVPLLILAMVLYLIAVVRDLRQHGLF